MKHRKNLSDPSSGMTGYAFARGEERSAPAVRSCASSGLPILRGETVGKKEDHSCHQNDLKEERMLERDDK